MGTFLISAATARETESYQAEMRSVPISLDAELLHAPIERLPAHAERARGVCDDASVGRAGGADRRRIGLVHRFVTRRARRGQAEILPPDRAIPRKQHRALDAVAQLADVAGPRMRDERSTRVLREHMVGPEEMMGERQDIV